MKSLEKLKTILLAILFSIASCSKNEDTPTSVPPAEIPMVVSRINPTSGSKNTEVIIAGQSFSTNITANTFSINGKECVVNQASSTQLTITILPAAGTGTIKVTNNGKTSESGLFRFIEMVTVSTLAGSGTSGFANGTGSGAQFNFPAGVAVDPSGNVYVADLNNHKIRKISPTGTVTTIVGSGTRGLQNGQGTSAQLDSPMDVVIGAGDELFVADHWNNRVRRITATGAVTTFAGTGVFGLNATDYSQNDFFHPTDIVIDANQNFFLSDGGNNRIRKISSGGTISPFVGSGSEGANDIQGSAASFKSPKGMAIDGQGNLYVVDNYGKFIRKVTTTGLVSTIAG